MVEYSLTEGGRLIASVEDDDIYVFDKESKSYVPFTGLGTTFFDARPITEEEAMKISYGVKADANSCNRRLE